MKHYIPSPAETAKKMTSGLIQITSMAVIWQANISILKAHRKLEKSKVELERLEMSRRGIMRSRNINRAVLDEILIQIEDTEKKILGLAIAIEKLEWCKTLDTPQKRQKAVKEILSSPLFGR